MQSLPFEQVRHLSIVPGLQHEVEVFGSHISTDETPAGIMKAINVIATILFMVRELFKYEFYIIRRDYLESQDLGPMIG